MSPVALFDLISLVCTVSALTLLLIFFKRFPLRDIRWLLLVLLLVGSFDHLSNFLEWSGFTSGWDYIEDFIQISVPLFFMMIFYGLKQIRARREVEASEKKFRNIAEQISDVIFITDAEGKISYISPSAQSVFGHAVEDMQSRPFMDFLPEDEIPRAFEQFRHTLTSGDNTSTFSLRMKRKDGEIIDGEINASVLISGGRPTGTQGVIRDVTERKKIEEVLSESEARLRQYIDIAGVVMLALDREGRVTMINRKGCEILSCDSQKMCGQNWFEKFVPENERENVLGVFYKIIAGEIEPVEYFQNSVIDGRRRIRIMAWHNALLRNKDGSIIGTLSSGEDITERMAADEMIRASEEKYRSLVENSTDIIARFDRDMRIIYTNKAVESFAEGKQEDLTGKSLREIGVEENRRVFIEENLMSVFNSGQVLDGETIFEKDRKTYTRNWRIIPEFNESGVVKSVIGVIRDVTEQRQAEFRYAQLFKSMLDGFAVHEIVRNEKGEPVDYRFLSVNPAFEKLTGLRADIITGKTALEVIPGLERVWLEKYFSVVETGEPLYFEQHAANLDRYYEGTAYRNAPEQFTVVFVDTTERRRAQEALKKNEEQLRLTIDSIQDMVHVVDSDMRLVLANNTFYAWCRKFGLDISAVGVKLMEAFPFLNDFVLAEYRSVFENGQTLLTEESNSLGDQVVYTETRKVPIIIDGKVSQVLTVVRDISERHQAEEERIRLQSKLNQALKLEAIGRLAGGVAHDFNNLLTGISGNVELALLDLPENNPLHEALNEINEGAERAASLTRQLLAFGRKQIIEPKAMSINALLSNLERMLGRIIGEDIRINWLLDSGLWQTQVDPGQIEQVVVNMVINSRDAMPDGGTITIETKNVTLGEDYTNRRPYVKGGEYVMLAVSDTGCGMDEATRIKIFEPFFTTKPEGSGSGLGLATSYGIIKQHNGSIEVYSEPGQGSTFKIYLPRVKTNGETERIERKLPVNMPGGSETILVVEDEEIVRNVALRILSRLGYKLLWAANGPDALEIADRHSGHIDMLMTDVVMPRMNGRELSEHFIRRFPDSKVLFTSGYTENVIAHHGVLDAGVKFIGKPYTPQSLAMRVREVLEGR